MDVQEAKHTLAGIAEILASYKQSILEQGFTNEEAIRLVIAYQRALAGQTGDSE